MKSAIIRKYISFILLISILFSGVCLEQEVRTDPFSCVDSQTSPAILHNFYNGDSHLDICNEKLVGVRTVVSIITQDGRSVLKTKTRSGIFFSLAGLLSNYSVYFDKMDSRFIAKSRTCTSAYIIRYIHLQDGEKA